MVWGVRWAQLVFCLPVSLPRPVRRAAAGATPSPTRLIIFLNFFQNFNFFVSGFELRRTAAGATPSRNFFLKKLENFIFLFLEFGLRRAAAGATPSRMRIIIFS